MKDKQIIIDGVDVSRCDFYDKDKRYCLTLRMYPKGFKNPSCFSGDFQQCIQSSKTCPETFCHNNPNCYFKQLKRKMQECERLKERLVRTEEDLKYQCVDCMNVKSDRYRKALEEIENYICEYEMLGKLNIKYILNIINEAKDGNNE